MKIFIAAGDPSGDIHGARLMKALKERAPGISFRGIGGENMAREGLESLVSISEISVVGFWEVIKKLPFFMKLEKKCQELMRDFRPDIFIPVDYPGFNTRMAAFAVSLDIPVYYYIAPQFWAWGKERAEKLRKNVDRLYAVFPFEVPFFSELGFDTRFFGHPLLDDENYLRPFRKFEERRNLIALLPGSRLQEIKRHAPLLRRLSERIARDTEYDIGILKSSYIDISDYENILGGPGRIEIFTDKHRLFTEAKAGIIKTGTSNLEAALSGLPFSMFYKTSALTYRYAKSKVDLTELSLVNILSDRKIINEFIQTEATPENLYADMLSLAGDRERYSSIQSALEEIRNQLGGPGTAARIAQDMLQ